MTRSFSFFTSDNGSGQLILMRSCQLHVFAFRSAQRLRAIEAGACYFAVIEPSNKIFILDSDNYSIFVSLERDLIDGPKSFIHF